MFGLFNSKKNLLKKYQQKLEEAVAAQRNGNIALYSELSSEADKLLKEIEEIESREQ